MTINREDFVDNPELRLLKKYMFIYGGYSIYCEIACNDMWMYEIAYGPMRMYPRTITSSDEWQTGNRWTSIKFTSTENPGYRAKHSMFSDSSANYVYLFGGYGQESLNSPKRVMKSDVWRFSIPNKDWEEINGFGITEIRRKVLFWDGTVVTKTDIKPSEIKETDEIEYSPYLNARDENKSIEYPRPRAGATVVLAGVFDKFLIVIGGYTTKSVENPNNSELKIELKEIINDMWVFSLISLKWRQIFPNSDINPLRRFGSSAAVFR